MDDMVADALIAARDRGRARGVWSPTRGPLGQPGFLKLLAAEITVIAGDGELSYLARAKPDEHRRGRVKRIDFVKDDPVPLLQAMHPGGPRWRPQG